MVGGRALGLAYGCTFAGGNQPLQSHEPAAQTVSYGARQLNIRDEVAVPKRRRVYAPWATNGLRGWGGSAIFASGAGGAGRSCLGAAGAAGAGWTPSTDLPIG